MHLHYLRIKKVAIVTQCVMRGRVARRELQKLKMVRLCSLFSLILLFYLFNLSLNVLVAAGLLTFDILTSLSTIIYGHNLTVSC